MRLLLLVLTGVTTVACGDSLQEALTRAGNADDDSVRLEILEGLRSHPELPAESADGLDRLIAEIQRWTTERRLDYFGSPLLKSGHYDFGVPAGSPFEPLTWIYEARMRTWVALEHSGVWSVPAERRKMLVPAREALEKAHAAFPENRIVAMYLGKRIPASKPYVAPENTPAWAAAQRESLERLADIVAWWIDHRLQPDGQYGGGWGDDCEMWRWWVPVLIAFDDPKFTEAQARFSRALLSQPHMKGGYTSHTDDVEHTAEDSADTITPMMLLEPDSPEWRDRALRLAERMETLWAGTNERGQLQFKSTYFNSESVDSTSQRACDTVYHPRAVQPALLYWQRTGDPKLGKLFGSWMDTWVDATARAERGKPAGVVPVAIHWPDGNVGGVGEHWWDPECHPRDPIYVWPSAMSCMLPTFLLAHHMTDEERYVEPLRSMAAIRMKYLENPPEGEPAAGSEAWCAAKMEALPAALAKYRLLTGSTEFDALLEREEAPYMRYRLKGDDSTLTTALQETAKSLRTNFPGYTSEVRYTDRVLRFPAIFGKDVLFEEGREGFASPDTALLYSTATGDPGDPGYFPMAAVRWLTPPRDIAALVTDSGRERFAGRLYHFGDGPRTVEAELYLLEPGRYELAVGVKDGDPLSSQTVEVKGMRTRVRFELPPHRECVVTVQEDAANQ